MLLMTYQLHEATCLLCQRSFNFFITKAENYINEGKIQIRDGINSVNFFKRKWFYKTIFERRTCKFH